MLTSIAPTPEQVVAQRRRIETTIAAVTLGIDALKMKLRNDVLRYALKQALTEIRSPGHGAKRGLNIQALITRALKDT